MSTLPTSWVETNLGSVVPYGATAKAEPEDLTPDTWVLELEDIEKDTTKVLQRVTFSERQSKSTKNRFDAGDVLYGKLRPYLNKVTFADQPGVCTTEIVPIKPSEAVDGRYLFHWLRHPRFLNYVTDVSHGVNMPRLGTEAGRQAPFVLAPKNEQKRIADILDTVLTRVDAVNTRLARVAPIVKRFRQSVLAAATSGRLTEDWRTAHDVKAASDAVEETPFSAKQMTHLLSKVRTPLKTGPFGTLLSKSEHVAQGIEVVGIENIDQGKFVAGSKIRITPEKALELSAYDLEAGDVIISRSGTVGEVCVVPAGLGELRFSTNIIRVVLDEAIIKPDYFVFLFLGCTQVLKQVDDLCKGSTRLFLNQTILNAISYPLPGREEQSEIISRVESLFAFADRLEACLLAAQIATERLTPALLGKAFRGELVPQDPNDEPASELLRRLQQEAPLTSAKRGRKSSA